MDTIIEKLIAYISFDKIVLLFVAGWTWYKFSRQNEINSNLQEQKNELDKNLKNYEQQLNQLIEDQKYSNQRKLTDFSLYANKKHERVIDLYEKLSIAQNQVIWRYFPLRELPVFIDYNEEDMVEFLDKFNITRATKEQLLKAWKDDKKKGADQIHRMMYLQEDFDTQRAIAELNKSHLQAGLYLSQGISKNIEEHIKKLKDLAFLCKRETRENISGEERRKMSEKRKELAESIENEFPEIIEKMKQWLLNDSDQC